MEHHSRKIWFRFGRDNSRTVRTWCVSCAPTLIPRTAREIALFHWRWLAYSYSKPSGGPENRRVGYSSRLPWSGDRTLIPIYDLSIASFLGNNFSSFFSSLCPRPHRHCLYTCQLQLLRTWRVRRDLTRLGRTFELSPRASGPLMSPSLQYTKNWWGFLCSLSRLSIASRLSDFWSSRDVSTTLDVGSWVWWGRGSSTTTTPDRYGKCTTRCSLLALRNKKKNLWNKSILIDCLLYSHTEIDARIWVVLLSECHVGCKSPQFCAESICTRKIDDADKRR